MNLLYIFAYKSHFEVKNEPKTKSATYMRGTIIMQVSYVHDFGATIMGATYMRRYIVSCTKVEGIAHFVKKNKNKLNLGIPVYLSWGLCVKAVIARDPTN